MTLVGGVIFLIISLSNPVASESPPLLECIRYRRSWRGFSRCPLKLSDLSTLLWAGQGLSDCGTKRTVPSAGGVYSVLLRILVRRVEGLATGIYEYQPQSHSLRRIGPAPTELRSTSIGIGDQPWIKDSAILIGATAELPSVIEQFEWQSLGLEQGKKYVHLEIGALTQNVHLCATAIGLGCVTVGGFHDSPFKQMFMVPQVNHAGALMCIGCLGNSL